MSTVVNLNRARKRKARAAAQLQAAENRVKFGRTLEQKQRDQLEVEQAQQRMDQLRRDPPREPV